MATHQFSQLSTATLVVVALLYGSATFRVLWSIGALSFAAQSPMPMELFNALSLGFQFSGIVYGIALTVWFWKLWKNSMILRPEGAAMNEGDLVWSTTKAVIWWYFPFVALVKPYFQFKEIWKHTTPAEETGSDSPPKSLLIWWLAVVVQTVFLALFNIAISPTRTMEPGPPYVHVLVGLIATIVTAIFGPQFIKAVSRRETAKIADVAKIQASAAN